MKNIKQIILYSLILVGVIAYSAICYHSIEEIHYLKSFFPRQFTVQEAYYATVIELIKIIIIGIPFFLVIGLCLVMLKKGRTAWQAPGGIGRTDAGRNSAQSGDHGEYKQTDLAHRKVN